MIPESYAKALYETASEKGGEEAVLEDFRSLCEIFAKNKGFAEILDSPVVSAKEKEEILERAFKSRINDDFLNFLKLTSRRRLIKELPVCFSHYQANYDAAHGIEYASVISASELDEGTEKRLARKLSALTGKKIVLRIRIDKSIIGGIVVKYKDTVYDGSVRQRLSDVGDILKGVS